MPTVTNTYPGKPDNGDALDGDVIASRFDALYAVVNVLDDDNFVPASGKELNLSTKTRLANNTYLQAKTAGAVTFNLLGVTSADAVVFGNASYATQVLGASLTVTPNATFSGTLGVTGAATFNNQMTSTLGTLTADRQNLSGTATWNEAATTFTAVKVNITDTASAAGSLLVDLQVGGSSKFNVNKAGNVTVAGTLGVTGPTTLSSFLQMSAGQAIHLSTAANYWRIMQATSSGNFLISRDGVVDAVTLDTSGNATFVGNLNVDSGTLYVDATNNVTGFGTASPATGVVAHFAGNIRWDGTTSTSATAGAQTLPSNPVGFVQVNIAGTNRKIPYYA
jgi:hypothetical protein